MRPKLTTPLAEFVQCPRCGASGALKSGTRVKCERCENSDADLCGDDAWAELNDRINAVPVSVWDDLDQQVLEMHREQ